MKRITFIKAVLCAAWVNICYPFPADMDIHHPKPPEPELPKPEVPKEKPKPKPVVTMFTASWCGPCQRLKAKLKSMKLFKYLTIADCSSDSNFSKYAKKYNFRGVPTIIVFVDGKEIARGGSGNAESLIRKYANEQERD